MVRSSVVLVVFLGACASDDGVSWRLPCGGTQYNDGAAEPTYLYAWEYDDGGHILSEVLTDTAGGIGATSTWEWDGDANTRFEWVAAGLTYFHVYEYQDGRIVSETYGEMPDLGNRYQETWRWADGELDRLDRDFAIRTDQVELYEDTDGGFSYTRCEAGAGARCPRHRVTGADYRGDFAHWTVYEIDAEDDGDPDYRYERSFDAHDLLLTMDIYWNTAGELEHWVHMEHEREPDGTALGFTYQDLTAPRSYAIVNDFKCR